MKIPALRGLIDRRILINYTADPEAVRRILPHPFRVQTYAGKAIVGICLIRLKQIRPQGFPAMLGIASENGAHRIAVEWEANGKLHQGVYIPRRDTSLWLNARVGGVLFPGQHHLARFTVHEAAGQYSVGFESEDDTCLSIQASEADTFPATSVFSGLAEASAFFERGAVGYSPHRNRFDGLRLQTDRWAVRPLAISEVTSSFFEDRTLFPDGVTFDNALLMTRIEHTWRSEADIGS
ncbi:MAG: DUF2071 domain-containing protein [Bacteroidia bacterium]|nr:DUF2071 domain-containing protein [Bacteroidia bacterium]